MNFVRVLGIETIDVMIVDGHVGKVFCRTVCWKKFCMSMRRDRIIFRQVIFMKNNNKTYKKPSWDGEIHV